MFRASYDLCDVISQSVYCTDDNSYMLTLESATNEFWIPSSKVGVENSWQSELSKECVDIFGSAVTPNRVIRLYRVWIPLKTSSYIYHCVYELRVNQDLKKRSRNTFGKYRGKVRWVTEVELQRLMTAGNLRSPEILEYFMLSKDMNKKDESKFTGNEMVFNAPLLEVNEQTLVTRGTSIFEQIVDAANISKDAQSTLYKEFLFVCFPALYLSQQAFSKFIMELGWTKDEVPFLYRAADLNNKRGLTFRDFIYFIAAVEPTTNHGGSAAELRCRYMFRFFDRDNDGFLSFNEFKELIVCIRKSKRQPVDNESVKQEAQTCYKSMGFNIDKNMGLTDFLRGVGDLKLRGTSVIFRSSNSIQQLLKQIQGREAKGDGPVGDIKMKALVIGKASTITQPMQTRSNGTRPCKFSSYEIAMHSVRLQQSGTMISVDLTWSLTCSIEPNASGMPQIFQPPHRCLLSAAITYSSTAQPTLSDLAKRSSVDQFSQKTVSNEVLKGLRYLSQINKSKSGGLAPTKQARKDIQQNFMWGQLDSNVYGRNLITVCNQVKELMKTENRLLELDSPIYVMGDLHGNFADLLYFEKILWHLGPCLCPCTLLFLGDYVDRGPYGMEVISYLFSYKVQVPTKVKLLRGNHEIRDIQNMFTFHAECINKFGDSMGNEVWRAINNAFDVMPLAAVIDGLVFCCHGGIPPPWVCPVVSTINSVPIPLSQPDEQSSLAWELMWNDPVRHKNITDSLTMELVANDGFAVNTRRGTAHVFSVEALNKFLQVNSLSHIIRAHEVAQAGFSVHLKGKLLTVFSSSKYCGGNNEAACILADQGKLRIMRLETA